MNQLYDDNYTFRDCSVDVESFSTLQVINGIAEALKRSNYYIENEIQKEDRCQQQN